VPQPISAGWLPADLFGTGRDLGVALGDVDHLDTQPPREPAPALAVGRHLDAKAAILGDVHQRLLHEVRDQPGIGAMGDHRRRAPAVAGRELQHGFAQRVVGAQRHRQVGIGVAARPGFYAGVDVERTLLLAELDQRRRGDLDREIDQEVALGKPIRQHIAIVSLGQTLLDELDAVALGLGQAAAVVLGDDGDLAGLDADMAQDERQHALADRAEADHDHATLEFEILLARDVLHHSSAPACSVSGR
jgi:hypothetical protein